MRDLPLENDRAKEPLKISARWFGMADDEKTVETVAHESVDRYGADAVPVLRERAEYAEAMGDKLAAKTWRDIADAAERMLRA
jgi:hypothetical protein